MTIDLAVIGKCDLPQVEELVRLYAGRIDHYCRMSVVTLPEPRAGKAAGNGARAQQRRAEGAALLRTVAAGDCLVLLDERGEQFSSEEMAAWLQKRLNSGVRRLVFAIGGPYGFSEEVYARADHTLSLSRMTFSHQVVRVIFCEQLYRAFTILGGEPYHHG